MAHKWVEQWIDGWTRWTVYAVLSFLWALSSCLLITGVPATIAVAAAVERADEGYVVAVKEFVTVFRTRFSAGSLLGLPLFVCLLFSVADAIAVLRMGNPWFSSLFIGLSLVVFLLVAACTLQGCALLLLGNLSFREVWVQSIRCFAHTPGRVLLRLCLLAVFALLSVRMPALGLVALGAVTGRIVRGLR